MLKYSASLVLLFSAIFFMSSALPYSARELPVKALKAIKYTRIVYPEVPEYVSPSFLAWIKKVSKEQDVPYLLVYKLIEKETQWHQGAVNYNRSRKGKILSIDRGIMQINSKYEKEFIDNYKDDNRTANSYNIRKNPFDCVEIGIKHLKHLYAHTGNWKVAVQAYNAGLKEAINEDIPDSTKAYAEYIVYKSNWWNYTEGDLVESD